MLKNPIRYYLANEPSPRPPIWRSRTSSSAKVATARRRWRTRPRSTRAIAAAVDAAAPMRKLPAYERQAVLEHCVQRFRER